MQKLHREGVAVALLSLVLAASPAMAQFPKVKLPGGQIKLPGGQIKLPNVGGSNNPIDKFLKGEPPLTSSMADATPRLAFMDKFTPKSGVLSLTDQPKTERGTYRLAPGFYNQKVQSY
jgi:hypothetical protein